MITSSEGFIVATPTKCGATTVEDVARRFVRNNGADGDMFRMLDWAFPRRKHSMALPPVVRDQTGGIVIDGHAGAEETHDEWEGSDRWLLLRNPFDRYVSIYKYLSLPRNYSQWGAREIQGSSWPGTNKDRWATRTPMSFAQFLNFYCDERERFDSPKGVRRRGTVYEGRAYRAPWVWLDSLPRCADLLAAQPAVDSDWGVVEGFLTLEKLWLGEEETGSLARLFATYGITYPVGKPLHANKTRAWGSERYGVYRDVTFDHEFWGGFGLTREGVELAGFRHVCSGMVCGLCRSGVVEEYLWWVTALAS